MALQHIRPHTEIGIKEKTALIYLIVFPFDVCHAKLSLVGILSYFLAPVLRSKAA